jgi:hypothetical protein
MPEPRCKHNLVICSRCVIVTDSAKRMSDHINGMITAHASHLWDLKNSYMAFRLEDGWSDGALYDTKQDAIRHTDHKKFAYFCFRNAMGGANPKDCQIFLNIHRHAYEHGGQLADPDRANGGPDHIMSTAVHDRLSNRSRLIAPKFRPNWLRGS